MLFLVISTPHPGIPEEIKRARVQFRQWIRELKAKNIVQAYYPRVGRGSVVIFDVYDNDSLHNFLHRWLTIVPATFEVHPLIKANLDEE